MQTEPLRGEMKGTRRALKDCERTERRWTAGG